MELSNKSGIIEDTKSTLISEFPELMSMWNYSMLRSFNLFYSCEYIVIFSSWVSIHCSPSSLYSWTVVLHCMSCWWGTGPFQCSLGRKCKRAALASAPPLSAKMMWCCFLPEEWIMEFLFHTDLFLFFSHTLSFFLFPCLLSSPLSLPLSFICVHSVLRMFISYQVKFIHISYFVTGPADDSFENINIWGYETAGWGIELGLSVTGRCWILLVAALREN